MYIKEFDLEKVPVSQVGIERKGRNKRKAVAIIGMACKLPSVEDIDSFWNLLQCGRCSMSEFPYSRRRKAISYLQESHWDKSYEFHKGAYLDNIDTFDYTLFDMNKKEADFTDPHQRVLLQSVYTLLEEAGYGRFGLSGSNTGVYIGYNSDDYIEYKRMIYDLHSDSLALAATGNIKSYLAGRLSYFFDLRGPAMLIDTACSSSLVALHTAFKAIQSQECDCAVVAGININLLPLANLKDEIGVLSPDGLTRTFDDKANGLGTGEGCVSLLLKELEQAKRDGDHIYAVMKGSAVNQDASSAGLTVPDSDRQKEVICRAWQDAEVDPQTITYLEAHGTGTYLGDPVEIHGLNKAFLTYTDRKQFCAIGSLKSNLGHLNCAAGLASVLKTVLMLKNKKLPPTLHFEYPNRQVPFQNTAVYINDVLRDWEIESVKEPRRCGVSSFGISGTNCHVVLEEFIETVSDMPADSEDVFTLSANTKEILLKYVDAYLSFLNSYNGNYNNLCYTVNIGREKFTNRLAVIAGSCQELEEKLNRLKNSSLNQNEEGAFYTSFAKESNDHIIDSDNELVNVASRYVKGGEVDWWKRYQDKNLCKVALPTYPFAESECWFQEVAPGQGLLHQVRWTRAEASVMPIEHKLGRVLAFIRDCEEGNRLAEALQEMTEELIVVRMGKEFEEINSNIFISGTDKHDLQKLMHVMEKKEIDTVIHAWTYYKKDGSENLDEGVYSLVHITKLLIASGRRPSITVLTTGADEVDDMANIYPENGALLGLVRALNLEFPEIRFQGIDSDFETGTHVLADCIRKEDLLESAFRNNCRYRRVVTKVDSKNGEIYKGIQDGNVYIITGGLGTLGLSMAQWLARKAKVNLVLVSRRKFPHRDCWNDCKLPQNSPHYHVLKTIQTIENMGSRVLVLQADIADSTQLQTAVKQVRDGFGKINGVIHSAGISGREAVLLMDETEATFKENLSAKLEGTRLLHDFTSEDNLDFFLLFSSVITLTGGVGVCAYTTANAYLDAFALYSRKQGRKTFVVNWPTWKKSVENFKLSKHMFHLLEEEEAWEGLDAILQKGIGRGIVGRINSYSELFVLEDKLSFRMDEGINNKFCHSDEQADRKIEEDEIINRMRGRASGYSEKEVQLANIWMRLLGLDTVNIYDNFYELAGSSILAAQLLREITSLYGNTVNIADIFSYPTIFNMAEFLDSLEFQDEKPQEENMLYVMMEKMRNNEITVEEFDNWLDKNEGVL